MEVEPFPSDLDPDRYVVALVVGLGAGLNGEGFRFQVDCTGVSEAPYPQAFAVIVPVESLADVARLTMHQHFRIILDQARKRPEYIQLVDGGVVHCEVTHEFGESRKDFEFIV